MAKDAFYFRHDANASSDLKLKALRKQYGWEGIGWWWYLVELLRSEENYELEYSGETFEGMMVDMGCESEDVKTFIDYCADKRLLEKSTPVERPLNAVETCFTMFYSPRLKGDMVSLDALREQRRMAGKKSAEKRSSTSKSSTLVEHPSNDRSTSRVDKSIVEREDMFKQTTTQFADKHTPSMITEFINYWTEPDRAANPRMRFEKERTWEMGRRLATWAKNDFSRNNSWHGKTDQPGLIGKEV